MCDCVVTTAYTMLACARIGAVHSVVFAGLSAESLRDRIVDASSKWVVTAEQGKRGGKPLALKDTVRRCPAEWWRLWVLG
jgi:acetyl-CoA synthetase